MFKPKTFQDLCNAMQTGAEVELNNWNGHIVAIQKEDGSGYNWNVTLELPEVCSQTTIFFTENTLHT